MAYTSYPSVAGTSLVGGGSSIAEEYIPLWVYSSGVTGTQQTSAGVTFVAKGKTPTTATVDTSVKLHTLNANWIASQKFAFECSIYTTSTSYAAYAALWDFTANAVVSGSQVSTTAAATTLLRSGSFTLIPGHVYGVTTWNAYSAYITNLTKAHLVALMM